jgi:hypothetical protein
VQVIQKVKVNYVLGVPGSKKPNSYYSSTKGEKATQIKNTDWSTQASLV